MQRSGAPVIVQPCASDRVVLLVTGDGQKTPGAVAHTYAPVHIPADADALLDRLQAA